MRVFGTLNRLWLFRSNITHGLIKNVGDLLWQLMLDGRCCFRKSFRLIWLFLSSCRQDDLYSFSFIQVVLFRLAFRWYILDWGLLNIRFNKIVNDDFRHICFRELTQSFDDCHSNVVKLFGVVSSVQAMFKLSKVRYLNSDSIFDTNAIRVVSKVKLFRFHFVKNTRWVYKVWISFF